jgi:hypothetical protein
VRSGRWLSGIVLEQALTAGVPPWLETNRYRVAAYLGRVNLVSLFPSALLAAGVAAGLGSAAAMTLRRPGLSPDLAKAALGMLVAVSFAGYVLLLVMYPTKSGDTVKATYLIHLFPLAAVLGADLLDRLHERAPRLGRTAMVALAAIAAHDVGAFLTRYRAGLG